MLPRMLRVRYSRHPINDFMQIIAISISAPLVHAAPVAHHAVHHAGKMTKTYPNLTDVNPLFSAPIVHAAPVAHHAVHHAGMIQPQICQKIYNH